MHNHYLGKGSKKGTVKPEVLYKRSRLFLDPATDEIKLQAVSHAVWSAPNADAECEQNGFLFPHIAIPSRFCACGFYAYKNYLDALSHPQTSNFILRVVASGKMFEYDKGYRYGHQRVEQVTALHCAEIRCTGGPDRLMVRNETGYIFAVCSTHSLEDQLYTSMAFSEFEERISASLPKGSPPVTICSADKKVVPWVRGQKSSLPQRLKSPRNRSDLMNKIAIGAAVAALSIVAGGMIGDKG